MKLTREEDPTKRRRDEPGQTLVEFCICALLLMMLVFAVVDLARGVFAYNTIAHCAREGVRYAVVHGSTSVVPVGPTANDASLAAVVRGFATGLNTNNLSVLSSWPTGNNTGMVVNLTVRYTFQPVTLFFRTLPLSNSSSAIILH
ncbi:MAG: pilus assembly protein [Verrucomicrobia bacterium]|nr:pilus assembly protein [Verrucomicrobiota bacterium]